MAGKSVPLLIIKEEDGRLFQTMGVLSGDMHREVLETVATHTPGRQ
jgi:hypothetical protein